MFHIIRFLSHGNILVIVIFKIFNWSMFSATYTLIQRSIAGWAVLEMVTDTTIALYQKILLRTFKLVFIPMNQGKKGSLTTQLLSPN